MKTLLNPTTSLEFSTQKTFLNSPYRQLFFKTGSARKDRTGQFSILGLNSTDKNSIQWL